MKLFTSLWKDPVGWSEWLARTKFHVFAWTLIHVAFVTYGFFLIEKHGTRAGAGIIIFIGVAYPCLYLSAIHQLLRIIKQKA